MQCVMLEHDDGGRRRGKPRANGDDRRRKILRPPQSRHEAAEYDNAAAEQADRQRIDLVGRNGGNRTPDRIAADHNLLAGPVHA